MQLHLTSDSTIALLVLQKYLQQGQQNPKLMKKGATCDAILHREWL